MYALTNGRFFDGRQDRLLEGQTLLVRGDRIEKFDKLAEIPPGYEVVDCEGGTVMPGLIDAHIHAYASQANLISNDALPLTYVAQHAHRMLGNMLQRGFTTARDCGGADHGLVQAIEDGLVQGPRLYYAGKMLSQTGGHGDFRHPGHGDAEDDFCWSCGCSHVGHLTVATDGVDAIRRAVRENFRRGASFIKFAASGGVSSPSGSITAQQYSDEEIRVIVDETERHERYCTAHVHPDAAIRRAIELGVHCLEHGSLIEADTAALAAEKGTWVVPTLSIAFALLEEGEAMGLAPVSLEKLKYVAEKMLDGLAHMRSAGVKLGLGTDLLGPLEHHQCMEFKARSQVFSNFEVLQQATVNNAELLGVEGELGEIKPGAIADLLVIEGNPLEDLSVLTPEQHKLKTILKRGEILNKTAPAITS